MQRLGYSRFVAQGGDWGALVVDADGPPGARRDCWASTPTCSARRWSSPASSPADSDAGARGRSTRSTTFNTSGSGYFIEHVSTRPHGRSPADCRAADSPVGLAAWLLDHDADSCHLISRAFVDGEPERQSHPRRHPGQHHALLADEHRGLGGPARTGRTSRGSSPPSGVTVPVAVSVFPDEIYAAPRSWVGGGLSRTSSTSTSSTRAGTSRPGSSRRSFPDELRTAFRSLR